MGPDLDIVLSWQLRDLKELRNGILCTIDVSRTMLSGLEGYLLLVALFCFFFVRCVALINATQKENLDCFRFGWKLSKIYLVSKTKITSHGFLNKLKVRKIILVNFFSTKKLLLIYLDKFLKMIRILKKYVFNFFIEAKKNNF